MRILVVEDEALIAMMLCDALEDGGHEVMGPASTEAEALAWCAAMRPDVALVDIHLRDGSDGVALARSLCAEWGLAVIFASAQSVDAGQARDVALGCISKPYEPETVLRSLEVARAIMDGGKPRCIPPGFELFCAA
jgi:DNA-binding response OmpR family regulator